MRTTVFVMTPRNLYVGSRTRATSDTVECISAGKTFLGPGHLAMLIFFLFATYFDYFCVHRFKNPLRLKFNLSLLFYLKHTYTNTLIYSLAFGLFIFIIETFVNIYISCLGYFLVNIVFSLYFRTRYQIGI